MLKTRGRVVNKIHELEAYALIDAKSHQQSEAAQPVRQSRPLRDEDLSSDFFYLEIFSGSSRLSSALEKRLRTAGRLNVKAIRFDVKTNDQDDILRDDAFNRLQALRKRSRTPEDMVLLASSSKSLVAYRTGLCEEAEPCAPACQHHREGEAGLVDMAQCRVAVHDGVQSGCICRSCIGRSLLWCGRRHSRRTGFWLTSGMVRQIDRSQIDATRRQEGWQDVAYPSSST